MFEKPSPDEQMEVHSMPQSDSQKLTESQKIMLEIKELKQKNKLATYARILEEIEEFPDDESVSYSTVRRVITGSTDKASSFSFEHVLVPIRDALIRLQEKDIGGPISPEYVDSLKHIILLQTEENARMQEQNETLNDDIAFLRQQIQKKDERMDRKDAIIEQKEAVIQQLRAERDELLKRLGDKR